MNKYSFALVALMAIFQLSSCKSSEPEPGPGPEQEAPELNISTYEIEVSAEGGNVTVPYIVVNPIDGEYLKVVTDADWMSVDSDSDNVMVSVSANESTDARSSVIHVSYSDIQKEISVSQAGDETAEPDPDPDPDPDRSYAISYDINGPDVTMNVEPSDNGVRYFFHYFELSKTTGKSMESLVQELVDSQIQWGEYFNMSASEVLDKLLSTGKASKSFILEASADYIGFACSVDDNAVIGDDLVTEEFRTGVVGPSDNVISVSLPVIGYIDVEYEITTTNDDPYVFVVVAPEDWRMDRAEDIVNELIEGGYDLSNNMKRGNASGVMGGLEPGMKHFAIAFGYLGGQITTDLVIEEFVTKGGDDPSYSEFEFEVGNITSTSAEVTVNCSVSGAQYFFDNVSADMDLQDVRNYWNSELKKVMDSGMELVSYWNGKLSSGQSSKTFTELSPGSQYRPYAFSIDMSTGKPATDIILGEIYSTAE